MPEAAIIQLQPQGPPPVPVPPTPYVQARLDKWERARTNHRFGDLKASTLTGILNRAADGDIADWIDLCEFALVTDAELMSLYDTRISRVAQADWIVAPNNFGNPNKAALAAEFVNEQMGRIEDLHQVFRELLHATATGVAVGENTWERDAINRCNYVRRIEFRHGHRFRYDESWQLRLYDHGRRRGEGSRYGEALLPNLFTVHHYRVVAGYPGIGGIMRGCIYPWLFGRWVEKFWIGSAEKYGDPMLYATVPSNTPENVRRKIQSDLENLANDHVGVVEEGVTIEAQAAAAATKSWEGYQAYLTRRDAQLAKAWLGASDIVSPGEHGSQAAVDTRASVALDPRMVTDGDAFAASMERALFKSLIALNPHKWGCPVEHVPVPVMRLKTADDEVHRDQSDLAQEQREEARGYTQEVGREGSQQQPPAQPGQQPRADVISLLPESKPQPIPLQPEADTRTLSYGDMLAIVKASSAGDIGREAAFEMITAGGVEHERALRMVGLPQAPTFATTTEVRPPPKAPAPASSPGRTTKTRPTTSRSPSPFVRTLRSASAGSAFSSLKASRKLPKS